MPARMAPAIASRLPILRFNDLCIITPGSCHHPAISPHRTVHLKPKRRSMASDSRLAFRSIAHNDTVALCIYVRPIPEEADDLPGALERRRQSTCRPAHLNDLSVDATPLAFRTALRSRGNCGSYAVTSPANPLRPRPPTRVGVWTYISHRRRSATTGSPLLEGR
jgi:hypothetical protein